MYRTKQATLETTESEFTAGSRAGITRKGRGRRRGDIGVLHGRRCGHRHVVESSGNVRERLDCPAPFGAWELR